MPDFRGLTVTLSGGDFDKALGFLGLTPAQLKRAMERAQVQALREVRPAIARIVQREARNALRAWKAHAPYLHGDLRRALSARSRTQVLPRLGSIRVRVFFQARGAQNVVLRTLNAGPYPGLSDWPHKWFERNGWPVVDREGWPIVRAAVVARVDAVLLGG